VEPEWSPPETPPALDEELLYAMRRENDWPKGELASAHAEVALDWKPALVQDDLARQVTESAQTTASAQGATVSAQSLTAAALEVMVIALWINAMLEREPELATAQSESQRAVDQSEWERGFGEGFRLGQRLT
jgi:hypothetical protein